MVLVLAQALVRRLREAEVEAGAEEEAEGLQLPVQQHELQGEWPLEAGVGEEAECEMVKSQQLLLYDVNASNGSHYRYEWCLFYLWFRFFFVN